ncbi:thiamine pyrophosphate-dependent enzyme [Gulosibacter faecalis]|uniref:2-oxoisovalerate dehydrogenase subunit alpha n=1 Tax=Gulosibacter faecalis TaxID=272240 RepID=A0ABW5UVN8_9MICO|nr:thiamine pyrophosphate-dependent enzyme [Gulosibacter faecalis]
MRDNDVNSLLPSETPIELLTSAGEPVEHDLAMPDRETLVEAYRKMVIARRWEAQVTALTRQGRLATYPSAYGQEAGEVGSVLGLADNDWLFPTYRESSALLTRGMHPRDILAFFRGDWHVAYDPYEWHASSLSTPLATQALHAVGFAHGERLQGRDTVTLAYLGDGSTSEGDTHEAMNFAATWQTSTVFFVQNNQYAISVPLHHQTRSRSIADRGVGLGMPGVRVDGNDVAAVIAVVREAAARARAGEGPTVIEAVTYRLEAHTNSDDPTRYRDASEADAWREKDAIARLERYLAATGEVPDVPEAEEVAQLTRDVMNDDVTVDPLELFEHVYAEPRASLREQRDALAAELATREA